MIINRSKNSDYHSQRNNKIVPWSSCNTTSMVMALKQAGVPLPDHYDKQPEDELSRFLRSPEAYEKQRELAPWSVGAYPPQEVHVCLEWGTNVWIGMKVVQFSTEYVRDDLLMAVHDMNGVVLSGRFPIQGTEMGHVVSVAGYDYEMVEEDGIDVAGVIIDDPYGDWFTDYRSHHGNDVYFPIATFRTVFERNGKYWAHIVDGR